MTFLTDYYYIGSDNDIVSSDLYSSLLARMNVPQVKLIASCPARKSWLFLITDHLNDWTALMCPWINYIVWFSW